MTTYSLTIDHDHRGYWSVEVFDGAGKLCEDTSRHLLRALVEAAFCIAHVNDDDNPPVCRGGHP